MKRLVVFSVLFVFALTAAAQEAPKLSEAPVHEVKVSAKKYEYSPSEIRVKQGERVRLVITATDRKHGFEIKELGIKAELEKGKETVVEFTAEKAGTYPFNCSNFCGFGHRRMRGTLVVEPADVPPPAGN